MPRIYLDNSATTKISDDVKKAMINALEAYGNPSSFHKEGREAKCLIENARKSVAKLIEAKTDEIIFTSGGSESNNTALNIVTKIMHDNPEKKEAIVSAIEHPSILQSAKKLAATGVVVHYLPVDSKGRILIDDFKKLLNSKTILVSIMLANNELGVIQDIKEIAKLCHENGALLHSDIVQAAGKIDVNINDLELDYASLSAHKICGPKGIGALFVREGAPYQSLILGGSQEKGKRAGTYNTLAIIGFGQAAKDAKNSPQKYAADIAPIKQKLRDNIIHQIPNAVINGDQVDTLPNILNVSFAGAEGESILLALDYYGIAVSTGSACASSSAKPSHVLMATKADPELAHGSIRFSFSLENSSDEVAEVMKYLPRIIKNLREISTIGVK